MTALSAHIRSHRAMAEALTTSAELAASEPVKAMLSGMARSHTIAADALEAGHRELEAKLEGK